MLKKAEVEEKYALSLREWAHFNGVKNQTLTSIKFGECWAYGAVLGYGPYEISAHMNIAMQEGFPNLAPPVVR